RPPILSAQGADQWCAVSRRCRLGHVISYVQSQLVTDHQGTDDQCALMISVTPEVPPVSLCQCISASCQCTSMPHISAHLSCLSVSPISAAYQCHASVLPFSAHQCLLISATYQCQSV
ncbi:unnamed protein product, partial [Staurois parvus]